MSADAGELREHKDLLVWPVPIPKEISVLFTMVFSKAPALINYICLVLTKTDTFHLIVPLNCLGQLIKDRIHEFPQVVHIDVICDNTRELSQIQVWFTSGFEKIKFYTINSLPMTFSKLLLGRAFLTSSSFDESIRTAIISMAQTRFRAKLSDIDSRIQIVKQFVNTLLSSLPVQNIKDFTTNYICPSCKFVYGQACQLACGHQQCAVCTQIRKSCATCSEDISRDQVKINENLLMEMQNLPICCSYCGLEQSFKNYEAHLKANHVGSIIRCIRGQKINDDAVTSLIGSCIWEIPNIEQIKNNAATDGPKSIYSPSFYSFPNGYKMCLRLFINGDEKGKGTHMSLFFVIMRGEYDNKLRWPFEFKTTFSLIDQSKTNDNPEHVSEGFWPNSNRICFECPCTNMNIGFGIPTYIPLDLFTNYPNRYIKNDTMFIKFSMELFAEKPTDPTMNGRGDLPNEEKHVEAIGDDISSLICLGSFEETLPKSK